MKVNIIYQTIRQKQIQMYIIAIILLHCLLLYNNNLWLIYLLCLVVSFIYFAMEFINLSIIQKNVRKCYEAFQNSISEKIFHVMLYKKRKSDRLYERRNQIQPELMHKLSSPYLSKIHQYFMNGYQILLNKFHHKPELQVYHSYDESCKKLNEKNYHIYEQLQCEALMDSQDKENMENKMQKFQKQIQEIGQNVQKETNIKLKYVKILIFKQFRQLTQTLIYSLFILFLIGYKVISLGSLLALHLHQNYIENLINITIKINERLTKEYIIFLIPLMINSIWKFQRICNEIKRSLKQKQTQNQQHTPQLHLSLIYKIIQPDSKSPLPISKNKQTTMKELIQPNQEESVQVIATLIYFQCTAEALLSLYAIIQFLVCISLRIYITVCPILHDILQEQFGQRSYNIWEQTKFIINRFSVLLLLLAYIGLKYHQSLNKTIGMKQALWGIHMTMDKITKFISFDLRKSYHKRMYKIFRRLVKFGIVKNSQSLKKSQKMHNLTSRDDLILQYYCSV